MSLQGEFILMCLNKNGDIRWIEHAKNAVVNEGLNEILDVFFNGEGAPAEFYIGLIDGGSAPVLSATDTMASHGGWVENVDYEETDRVEWEPAAASGQAVTNSIPVQVNINDIGVIAGIFITTDDLKGGSDGLLWSTALFANGNKHVEEGDTLQIFYTVTAGNN